MLQCSKSCTAHFLGSECCWEGRRGGCASLSQKSYSFGWRAKHSLGKLGTRFYSHQPFVPRCNLQLVSCRESGRWTMVASCLLLKKAATQIGTYHTDSSSCFTGLPQIPKQFANPMQSKISKSELLKYTARNALQQGFLFSRPCGPVSFLAPPVSNRSAPGWTPWRTAGHQQDILAQVPIHIFHTIIPH